MAIIISEYFDPAVVEAGRRLLAEKRQPRIRQKEEGDRLVLIGRFADTFNFVDRAQVELDSEETYVISARCDCAEGRFCTHCAALLLAREAERQTPSEVRVSMESPTVVPEDAPIRMVPMDAPEVEAEGSINISDLCYQFYNCRSDLYPETNNPEIPLERFELMYGKSLQTLQLYEDEKEWGGSCYGMTSSAALFFHPGNNVSVADFRRRAVCPWDLETKDTHRGWNLSLRSFIEAMHITQYSEAASAFMWDYMSRIPVSEKIQALVDQVQHAEETGGSLPLFNVFSPEGGHSVLPYRFERLDKTHSRLHIYDPNCSGKVRYCDLLQDQAGNYLSWRFFMYDNTEYHSDRGCDMNYVPHEIYQGDWDHRVQPTSKALLGTNCQDLTLLDEAGNPVAKLIAGRIQTFRDDVAPILHINGGSRKRHSFWLNPGTYQVINEAPEREPLTVTLTGKERALSLETEISRAVITLDEEKEVQRIQLEGEEKTFLAKLLDKADQILIRGVGSAVGTILGIALKSLIFGGINAPAISEFRINDQEADIRDYLVQEESDREEEDVLNINSKKEPEPKNE